MATAGKPAVAAVPVVGGRRKAPEFDVEEARSLFGDDFLPLSSFTHVVTDPSSGETREEPHPDAAFDLSLNSHLKQNEVGFFRVPLQQLPKTLLPTMPRKKYAQLGKEHRSTLHWGVRKLLLAELDFLRIHSKPGMLVVYAGASPGLQIPYLAAQFPALTFLLLDGAQIRVKETEAISIMIPENMTDPYSDSELARVVTDHPEPKIFISDIRTSPPTERTESDEYVRLDMVKQLQWHDGLKPVASLLKFRLPWEDGTTQFYSGEIHFTPFGPQTTTETRMVVLPDTPLQQYDHRIYEEQMFYFNRVTRVQYYDHQLSMYLDTANKAWLDHCYDCSREVQILQDYLVRFDSWYLPGQAPRDALTGRLLNPIPVADLLTQVAEMSESISTFLESQKTAMLDPSWKTGGGGGDKGQSAPAASKEPRVQEEEEDIDYGTLM